MSKCKQVLCIDFSWLSKRKTYYCLSFNKSVGFDPFNSKALELLLSAISHSKPPAPSKSGINGARQSNIMTLFSRRWLS